MRLGTRVAFVVAVIASLLVLTGAPVGAHTDLESTAPADGAVLSEAPEHVEVRFTGEVEPAGDGMQLFSSGGQIIRADVTTAGNSVFLITPTVSLESGGYTVVWSVRSGDSHPLTGTFSFRVDAARPPADPELSDASVAADGDATSEPPTTVPAGEDAPQEDEAPRADVKADTSLDAERIDVAPIAAVAEADTSTGDWIGRIGRWFAMVGILLGIGAVAFGASALVGSVREVTHVGFAVRWGGVLVLIGTTLEALGATLVNVALGDALGDALATVLAGSLGFALALRWVGGAGMLLFAPVGAAVEFPSAGAPPRAGGSPASSVAVQETEVRSRCRLDIRAAMPAIAALAAVSVSYLFDGHTVRPEHGALVRIGDLVHVLAAGVWLGGVGMLAFTMARRHRLGIPLEAGPMAVRFSRIAAVALGAVAVAGMLLAWVIVDSLSELFTTPWGRALLVKLALVGVAVGMGAYNHFKVVPLLEADPSDEAAADRIRRVTTVEASVLVLVVAATAILVGLPS